MEGKRRMERFETRGGGGSDGVQSGHSGEVK